MLKLLRILLVTSLTALGAFVILPLPFLVWGTPALPGATEIASWRSLSLGSFYPSAQVLGVWLAGSWLGVRAGTFAMVLYLALGIFGLPVFIDGGGVDYAQQSPMAPLLAFPIAAWIVARLKGEGRIPQTVLGLALASLLITGCAMASGVAGSGLWFSSRQWWTLGMPHLHASSGWLVAMGVWALGIKVIHRMTRRQPSPPADPETEPQAASVPPIALPGAPRQKALPPSLVENAKRLADPSKRPPPGR